MFEFLSAPENVPFAVSLGLMFSIAVLEGVATLFGLGFSSMLDQFLPDVDFDVGAPELDHGNGLTKALGWLRIDKTPVLVTFVIFLTSFGLIGYIAQSLSQSLFGGMMPALLASVLAFFASLPVVRTTAGVIGRFIPKDESSAVSEDSLIGRTAIITMGVARVTEPVQARVFDEHGRTHYVMVEPDVLQEEFSEGEEVLLVKRDGAVFKIIKDTTSSLVN